jgi:hypothetical protein
MPKPLAVKNSRRARSVLVAARNDSLHEHGGGCCEHGGFTLALAIELL